MQLKLEENPTRQKILLLLKTRGGLTNDELSKLLHITPMGVRQHLLALEKKGFVSYDTARHGIGRPNFVYKLTGKADTYFPSSYDKLALQILKEVEEKEGRPKVDTIFQWRKERLLGINREFLGDKKSVKEKAYALADVLREGGYLIEFDRNGKGYTLKQYNCPIKSVSSQFPEACKYELQLYRDLLGQGVERTQCLTENGTACEYLIPDA